MKRTTLSWSALFLRIGSSPTRKESRFFCRTGERLPVFFLPMRKGSTLLLLALVALSLQGCLGGGGSSGQNVATSTTTGQQVSVNQDVFKGKFYLTINHNLYVLNG